jgi:hypothetical protein
MFNIWDIKMYLNSYTEIMQYQKIMIFIVETQ